MIRHQMEKYLKCSYLRLNRPLARAGHYWSKYKSLNQLVQLNMVHMSKLCQHILSIRINCYSIIQKCLCVVFTVRALNEGRRVENLVTLQDTQNDHVTRNDCKKTKKKRKPPVWNRFHNRSCLFECVYLFICDFSYRQT